MLSDDDDFIEDLIRLNNPDVENKILEIDLTSEDTVLLEDYEWFLKCPTSDQNLPLSFFQLPENVRLWNECKPLCINIVDYKKHPWYYKKNSKYDSVDERDKVSENVELSNDVKPDDDAYIDDIPYIDLSTDELIDKNITNNEIIELNDSDDEKTDKIKEYPNLQKERLLKSDTEDKKNKKSEEVFSPLKHRVDINIEKENTDTDRPKTKPTAECKTNTTITNTKIKNKTKEPKVKKCSYVKELLKDSPDADIVPNICKNYFMIGKSKIPVAHFVNDKDCHDTKNCNNKGNTNKEDTNSFTKNISSANQSSVTRVHGNINHDAKDQTSNTYNRSPSNNYSKNGNIHNPPFNGNESFEKATESEAILRILPKKCKINPVNKSLVNKVNNIRNKCIDDTNDKVSDNKPTPTGSLVEHNTIRGIYSNQRISYQEEFIREHVEKTSLSILNQDKIVNINRKKVIGVTKPLISQIDVDKKYEENLKTPDNNSRIKVKTFVDNAEPNIDKEDKQTKKQNCDISISVHMDTGMNNMETQHLNQSNKIENIIYKEPDFKIQPIDLKHIKSEHIRSNNIPQEYYNALACLQRIQYCTGYNNLYQGNPTEMCTANGANLPTVPPTEPYLYFNKQFNNCHLPSTQIPSFGQYADEHSMYSPFNAPISNCGSSPQNFYNFYPYPPLYPNMHPVSPAQTIFDQVSPQMQKKAHKTQKPQQMQNSSSQVPSIPMEKYPLHIRNPPVPMQNLPLPMQNTPPSIQNPTFPMQNPTLPMQNPTLPIQNPPLLMQNPPLSMQNPPLPMQNTPFPIQNPPFAIQNSPLAMQNQVHKPPNSTLNPFYMQKPLFQIQNSSPQMQNAPPEVQMFLNPIQKSSPHMVIPPTQIQKPPPQIQNPGLQMQNPALKKQNLALRMQNPALQMQNPPLQMQNPPLQNHSPQVQKPSTHLQNPDHNIKKTSLQIQRTLHIPNMPPQTQELHTQNPCLQTQIPPLQMQKLPPPIEKNPAQMTFIQIQKNLQIQKRLQMQKSSFQMQNSPTQVHNPTLSIQNPPTQVHNPTLSIQNPPTQVHNPTLSIQNQSSRKPKSLQLQKPSYATQKPTQIQKPKPQKQTQIKNHSSQQQINPDQSQNPLAYRPNVQTIQEVRPNITISRNLQANTLKVQETPRNLQMTNFPENIRNVPNVCQEKNTSHQNTVHLKPNPTKGYSPPILPIPTYSETLEYISKNVDAFGYPQENKCMANTIPNNVQPHSDQRKRKTVITETSQPAKKITLEEYKNRTNIECNYGNIIERSIWKAYQQTQIRQP